jgi:hypothetical protein
LLVQGVAHRAFGLALPHHRNLVVPISGSVTSNPSSAAHRWSVNAAASRS